MGCIQSVEEREAAEKRRFLKAQEEVNLKLIRCLCQLQFQFYMNGVCFDSSNQQGVDIVSCSIYYNLNQGSDYLALGASRTENAFALTQALINCAESLPLHFSSLYLGLRRLQENLPDGVQKHISNPQASTKKAHAFILRQHWQIVGLMKKLFTGLDGNYHQFSYIRRYVQVCNHLAHGLKMKPDSRVFVVPETLTVPYAQGGYVKTYHEIFVPEACDSFCALSDVLDKIHRYLGVGALEFSKHSPKFVEDRVIVFSFIHRNVGEDLYFGVNETREAKMTRMLIDRARASLTERERRYYTGKQKILPEAFSSFYQSLGKIQIMLNDSFTHLIRSRRDMSALRRNGDRVGDIHRTELLFKLYQKSAMWEVLTCALSKLNHDLNVKLQEGEEKLKETLQGYLEVFHEIEIVVGNSAV